MLSRFHVFKTQVWVLLSLGFVLMGSGTVSATPPKPPKNLTVETSLSGTLGETKSGRYFLLNWEDNSVNESGFRVEIRYGNTGAFGTLAYTAINETQYVFAYDFGDSFLVQFRVQSFKYNGAVVESSPSNIVQIITSNEQATLNVPSNFAVTNVVGSKTYDGVLDMSWNDNSTAEIFYQVFYREKPDSGDTSPPAFTTLGNLHWFNTHEALLQPGLVPGREYQFTVRATRRNDSTTTTPTANLDTSISNIVNFTFPVLNPPTELSGEALDQEQIVLRWKDNSTNETGYQIEYKALTTDVDDPPDWTDFSTVNANTTSFTVTTGPGVTLEWRVSAIYEADGETTIVTAPSNVHTVSTQFPGPTGLTATTSGVSGAVNLTWQDLSDSETNYDIYTRVVGTTDWYYAQSMVADTTRATVTTRSELDEETSSYVDVPLAIDSEHEFYVEARYSGTGAVSEQSNTASAYARHGFTSRGYQPAKVGVLFSYTMEVSNDTERTSWEVSDLPTGLTFDAETGEISGTPEVSGPFVCPMTVSYTSGTATTPLTLRVLKVETSPVVTKTIDNTTLGTNTQFTIPLADKFVDDDSEKAVRLKTTNGDINVLLYPSLTPQAVNNFLGYVDNGAYDGVIFHRSVPTFVVQGGAYVPVESPNYFSSLLKRPSPLNEPGISNIRGTIAAAKVGGSPDSATHDFFFNLEDNSLKEGIELDNQNGGFTVFARVAGTGMDKVDAIAALPIGVYKDYNSSGGTDEALDRRVILDGSKAAFEEVPMNATGSTAPSNMDVTQTVQILKASSIPVLTYAITSNSEPTVVRTSIQDGNLLLEGLVAGSSTIVVRASDLDGNSVDQSFSVNVVRGYKVPVIKRQPVSVAVLPGKKATLTVTATGSNLQYQWRKAGVPIDGATDKKLAFSAVQEADTGDYDVLVSNDTTTLTSDTAKVSLRTAPEITSQPVGKVVEVGQPLVLTTTVTGAPDPSFTWRRSGKTVSGQKEATLNIPAAKVTDGGRYDLLAKNVAGKVYSNTADVIVVDKSSPLAATVLNKTVVLKAQASGPPGMLYQWKKDGSIFVEDGDNIKGSETATLTIKKVTANETYTCSVRTAEGDLTAVTGAWRVVIVQRPIFDDFTPDTAYVGIDYDYTLPGGGEDSTNISSFSVSGLPSGLKLDARTGRITGKANAPGNYTLKVSAKNPAGKSATVTANMVVLPLPEAVVGTFVGQVGVSDIFNEGQGGRIDMTVTDGGKISGKLTMGKDVLSFTGTMDQTAGAIRTTGQATVKRKGNLAPLQMSLSALSPSGYTDSGNVTGTLTDGENSVAFTAYRKIYNINWSPNFSYVGKLNIGLTLPTTSSGQLNIPQGQGYLVATPDNAGTVSIAGRLADGTTVTCSSFLGGQQQFLVYQSLYKKTGAILGQSYLQYIETLSDNSANRFRVDGELVWKKGAQSSSKEFTYKEGFGPLILDALGMSYIPQNKFPEDDNVSPIVMSLPNAEGNASLNFDEGGLEASEINPDVLALRIKNNNDVSITSGAITNPGKATLNINASTGFFSGSFELSDPSAPSRKASYAGLIIQQIPTIPAQTYSDGSTSDEVPGTSAGGVGYFLLSQLPSEDPPTTLKTSPILSGRVHLRPAQITISEQPLSQSVDPGSNVTFTVVAAAPDGGALTYQWRKDGESISNAKTSSYSLTSVTESKEGSYDVVITTAYSQVISDPAVLTINDPVSNVTIARNPTTSPLPVNGAVTFTVTANGSGPLTYRWRKDGSDISGDAAANATYTLDPLSLTDSGTYSVRVSNAVTTAGVTSGGISIVVANPIASVTAQRSPSTEAIGIGGTVTFLIASITGSSSPYTYQWRKDGQDIESAVSSTYTINFVNPESAGNYSVLVKNGPTPDGVLSNEVSLAVSTEVQNVNASRIPANEFLPLESAVTFVVSTQGAEPFTYQWKKNGEDIEGAVQGSYTIDSISTDDVASYTVLVANDTTPEGVLSNPVELKIQEPITTVTITKSKESTELEIGDTIELTANPDGSGPYSYLWYKNEEELSTETNNVLVLSSVGEADAGDYRVVVSNELNETGVSSETVTITIIVP